jgi:FAD/FMN-containing dehydrogenase
MTTITQLSPALDDFRGELIRPDDERYDAARALHNGMFDRHPALIARCADTGDVVAALRHARAQGLPVAVRGGSHNGGGLASVDDGVCIDLSAMRGVRVNPADGTVDVQGGALLGDVDHATHAFGRALPSGIISTTGVGGITLGGGIGHLSRSGGLTIDNLVGADVVLADGRVVRASAEQEPDLFWAIRGGGGNFGIVTSFTFRTLPVGNVYAGPMLWRPERAEEIMRAWSEFLPQAPRELGGFFAFLIVPPVDPFPEALRMKPMCGVVWTYAGPPAMGDEALAPMRALEPELDGVAEVPLPAWNSAFDGLYPAGIQQYWRADFIGELNDEAIAQHVKHGPTLPSVSSTMHLYPIDGAVHDVPVDGTAFAARDVRFAMVILGADGDPARAGELRDWVTAYHEAVHPHAARGAYVNFMMEEGADRVRDTYGPNYDRLRQVKRDYDPDNVFHINQNIPPA